MATFTNGKKSPLSFQPLIRCKATIPNCSVPQVSITTPKGLLTLPQSEVAQLVAMVAQFKTQPGLVEVSSRGSETSVVPAATPCSVCQKHGCHDARHQEARAKAADANIIAQYGTGPTTKAPITGTATVVGCALPLFETVHGMGCMRLELDAYEIDTKDPGSGTPAMVYRRATDTSDTKRDLSGTFWCVDDTGEIDGYLLTSGQAKWVALQAEHVETFVTRWTIELSKRGISRLAQPDIQPQTKVITDGGCEWPGCERTAYAQAAEGFEGYVDACGRHARRLFMDAVREGVITTKVSTQAKAVR
jgi:hypothetical protein